MLWKVKLNIAPFLNDFSDNLITFESARAGICNELKKCKILDKCGLAEELETAEDVEEFDDILDQIYDVADQNAIWISGI